jgi:hypothetical protein
MRLRSVVALVLLSASNVAGQNRVIDEGVFVVLKGGAPSLTESFRVTRNADGLITATGKAMLGTVQTTSTLTTDTLGTPLMYECRILDKGAQTSHVRAASRAGRLTSYSSTQMGDESMREYPLVAGQSLIIEPGLLHHLYFVSLAHRTGSVQIIEPRATHGKSATVSALGLEPIEVAGRSVTATHYSISNGPVRQDFWVDSQGRLLRVDIPSQGLSATREELPR